MSAFGRSLTPPVVGLVMLTSVARAAEPTATLRGDTVEGVAVVAASPSQVLAALGDPSFETGLGGRGTRAGPPQAEAGCQRVAYVAPNAIYEARYTLRRCPTASGWDIAMIEANAFESYRATWRVEPQGEGTRVTYSVTLSTSLWVPNSVVRSETRGAVLDMMRGFAAWTPTP